MLSDKYKLPIGYYSSEKIKKNLKFYIDIHKALWYHYKRQGDIWDTIPKQLNKKLSQSIDKRKTLWYNLITS